MKLQELMQGYKPSDDYEGWVTNDDFVLAINTTPGTELDVSEYCVAQMGIEGLDSSAHPDLQSPSVLHNIPIHLLLCQVLY